MSSSTCFRCGLATASLLPSGLCPTCHGLQDETRHATAHPAAPTASFLLPSPAASTLSQAAAADPFGVLPDSGYRYAEELGRGGMGCVFKAVRLATEQTVAVKKLRPEVAGPVLLARFVREARLLAGLDHPNIVRLFDFVPDPNDPHLVMEFVDGEPLSRHLADGRVLPPERAAELMADAARGVHAAHQAGVIHRDLKPGNLLLTRDGRVKVSDFGLGKRLGTDDGLTVTGQLVGGTPGFMAPEQVDDTAPECDCRADVWGLGACLYATVAGKPPFPTGTKNATRVLSDPLVPPRAVNPAVPPVLDAIICKCLDRDPARRYQTAAAVADDLGRYLRNESTEAKPLPWAARVWNKVRAVPRATATAWAVVATACVLVAAVVLLTPKRETPPAPKVDELALLQERFRANETVTLVPEKGLPKWSEWVVGGGQFVKSPNGDGSAGLTTVAAGAVKLFDPPVGENSYTADFEIRHVGGDLLKDPMGTWVGCFFGHERVTGENGSLVDSLLVVHFADFDPDAAVLKPPTRQPVGVSHTCYYRAKVGESRADRDHPLNADALRFQAKPNFPGEWRHVRVEVTPERARVLWVEGGQEKLVIDRTAAQLDAHLQATRSGAAAERRLGVTTQNPELFPTRWKPDGGFGLICSSSSLTARNVTVRRTGSPP